MFEDRVRRLVEAHRAGYITDDECQEELAILQHRYEILHPIPVDRAVRAMAQIAGQRPHSRVRRGAMR